jgi:hypothetical protein
MAVVLDQLNSESISPRFHDRSIVLCLYGSHKSRVSGVSARSQQSSSIQENAAAKLGGLSD